MREKRQNGLLELSALAYRACELAYTRCGGWLDALLQVLDRNRQLTEKFAERFLPKAVVSPLEGTYLMWLDLRGYGYTPQELERRMVKAYLFLDEGYIFGKPGEGFERLNVACPSAVLEAALARLETALN